MSRKVIIISILSLVIITGAVIGGLALFKSPQVATTPDETKPDTSNPAAEVVLNKDPCILLTVDSITSILGSVAKSVKPGVSSDATALNGETAEDCAYTFTTAASDNNSLSMQTYLYKPDGNETPGLDWYNIDKTDLPTYFKEIDSADKKTHTYNMRVINGPTNYLYVISQPTGKTSFDMMAAIDVLRNISKAAKYVE